MSIVLSIVNGNGNKIDQEQNCLEIERAKNKIVGNNKAGINFAGNKIVGNKILVNRGGGGSPVVVMLFLYLTIPHNGYRTCAPS